jgi:hypothetical protein
VKSPSVAALVISPKARTWAVKFIAIVLTSEGGVLVGPSPYHMGEITYQL